MIQIHVLLIYIYMTLCFQCFVTNITLLICFSATVTKSQYLSNIYFCSQEPHHQQGSSFSSCVILSSHEDAPAQARICRFLLENDIKPINYMGDSAKAMTKAGRDEFCSIDRWSHVHRTILPQLYSIATFSAELSQNILNDIQDIQWSVLNHQQTIHEGI